MVNMQYKSGWFSFTRELSQTSPQTTRLSTYRLLVVKSHTRARIHTHTQRRERETREHTDTDTRTEYGLVLVTVVDAVCVGVSECAVSIWLLATNMCTTFGTVCCKMWR